MPSRRTSADQSLAEFAQWLRAAPAGTTIPASEVAARLEAAPQLDRSIPSPRAETWREKLWTVASETRLGVAELSEAIGRSADYVYRHTAPNGTVARIPHRKLDGALIFTAGELRGWIERSEVRVTGPRLRLEPRTTRSTQPLTARA